MFNLYNNNNKINELQKLILKNKIINATKYNFINLEMKNQINKIILEAKIIINNYLLPIIKSTEEKLEGNIFMFHESLNYTNEFIDKQINFILASKREKIKNVLEIGFNAGFSTLLMLLSNKNITITCVDICSHKYTKLCYNKLKELFGKRLNLIEGSSVNILPKLIGNTYDLIHIDGCHLVEIAEKDIQNSIKLCRSGTILIMDDTNGKELYDLWLMYSLMNKLMDFYPGNFIYTKYHDIKCYP